MQIASGIESFEPLGIRAIRTLSRLQLRRPARARASFKGMAKMAKARQR